MGWRNEAGTPIGKEQRERIKAGERQSIVIGVFAVVAVAGAGFASGIDFGTLLLVLAAGSLVFGAIVAHHLIR